MSGAHALGRDAARRHKRVEVKKGRRVVVGEDPDLKRAVGLLDAARAPVKARDRYALDALTLTDAATLLAACHLELGQNARREPPQITITTLPAGCFRELPDGAGASLSG